MYCNVCGGMHVLNVDGSKTCPSCGAWVAAPSQRQPEAVAFESEPTTMRPKPAAERQAPVFEPELEPEPERSATEAQPEPAAEGTPSPVAALLQEGADLAGEAAVLQRRMAAKISRDSRRRLASPADAEQIGLEWVEIFESGNKLLKRGSQFLRGLMGR